MKMKLENCYFMHSAFLRKFSIMLCVTCFSDDIIYAFEQKSMTVKIVLVVHAINGTGILRTIDCILCCYSFFPHCIF